MPVTGNNFSFMTDFSIVDDSFDHNITLSYFLSIRITPDGFSFCTLDPVRNKFIQIQNITFDPTGDPLKQSESCFKTIEKLNLPYKKTLILLPTQNSTLVPAGLYNEDQKDVWMQFVHSSPQTNESIHTKEDSIIANPIKLADAINLFRVNDKLASLMKRQFQEPQFFHQHTPIIENHLSTNLTDGDRQLMFINLEFSYFDIFIFGKNNLKLCNTFNNSSSNDFIYFTLFVFEQMKLNSSTVSVIISGHHPAFSEMVNHLKKYLKNIQLAQFPHQFQYSHLFRDVDASAYHTLLSLSVCV
jgi:hypothetical protein